MTKYARGLVQHYSSADVEVQLTDDVLTVAWYAKFNQLTITQLMGL
jgi:hypothetical protein